MNVPQSILAGAAMIAAAIVFIGFMTAPPYMISAASADGKTAWLVDRNGHTSVCGSVMTGDFIYKAMDRNDKDMAQYVGMAQPRCGGWSK